MNIGHHWTVHLVEKNDFTVLHLDTLLTLWLSMAIIIVFAAIAVGKLNILPTKIQAIFEKIVLIFSSLTKDMGEDGKKHTPILLTLFLLIITSNLLGQLPWKILNFFPAIKSLEGEFASPTNDINVTAALAIIVLVYYLVSGIKAKGWGYFKHYYQPVWFMTPFNMLEDIVKPITLALRLFANILAGEILIMVLAALMALILTPELINGICQFLGGFLPATWVRNFGLLLGSFIPLPIMLFELFVAFIQALVFTLLTNAYIQTAAKKH